MVLQFCETFQNFYLQKCCGCFYNFLNYIIFPYVLHRFTAVSVERYKFLTRFGIAGFLQSISKCIGFPYVLDRFIPDSAIVFLKQLQVVHSKPSNRQFSVSGCCDWGSVALDLTEHYKPLKPSIQCFGGCCGWGLVSVDGVPPNALNVVMFWTDSRAVLSSSEPFVSKC